MVSEDYYIDEDSGLLVFTSQYHIKRGYCCGKKCRHCPYLPRHRSGVEQLDEKYKSN